MKGFDDRLEADLTQTMLEHSHEPPLDHIVDSLKSRQRRRPARNWAIWGFAAAVVVLLTASITTAARSSRQQSANPTELTAIQATPRSSEGSLPSGDTQGQLAVVAGDKVEAVGLGGIGTRPDGSKVLCGIGLGPAGPDPAAADCDSINTTTIVQLKAGPGVSLTPSLTTPVAVRGVFDGHDTITVTSTDSVIAPRRGETDSTPCPTPEGGWGAAGDTRSMGQYVDVHPDEYLPMRLTSPSPGTSERTVPTIGTKLDPSQARATLTENYAGALCVYPVSRSLSDLTRVEAEARGILQRYGVRIAYESADSVVTPSIDYKSDAVTLNVALLTPDAARALSPLGQALVLTASVRPQSDG